MKNVVLAASLALNAVLLFFVVFLLTRPERAAYRDSVASGPVWFDQTMNENDVVFLGGSRAASCNWTVLLADSTVRNFASPGNTLGEEFKRLDFRFSHTPSQLFLLFGLEDLKEKPVNEVFEMYKNYIEQLRKRFPSTEVVIISEIPVSQERTSDFVSVSSESVSALNAFLRIYSNESGVPFINWNADLTDDEGNLQVKYAPKGVALVQQAYIILKDRLKPYLKQ